MRQNPQTGSAPIVLFTGVQRFARQIRRMGYVAACLKEPQEKIAEPEEVGIWVPYDPADLPALETWARNWPLKQSVVAVINRRERRVAEHALLNRALGRPGIQPEQAEILRDKYLLRRHLSRRAPHLNPPFELAHLAGAKNPEIPYPLLIKPRNLFKSQLVTLCASQADWKDALAHLRLKGPEASRRHGVEPCGSFLAEAYLDGREVSVDAFIASDGHTLVTPPVALIPARHWGFEDFHVAARMIPCPLSSMEHDLIETAISDLVRALELRSTPLHVDLTLRDGEVFVLDVAPRIGGYRSEMMELAFGCALDPLNLRLASGATIEWAPKLRRSVSVVELFPRECGTLSAVEGLDAARALPSFHRLRLRIAPGDPVGLARDGYRCPIFFFLVHEDPTRVLRDTETLRTLVRLIVEPFE